MKPVKAVLFSLVPLLSWLATPAHAEGSRHMVSAGWLHLDARPDSDPLTTTSLRTGASRTDTNTSFSVDDVDTAALTYSYSFTDNISGLIVGGLPPEVTLKGSGTSSILGNLDQYGSLATAKQMSPTLLGQYTFGDRQQTFRPFVGVGVTYTKLKDAELNPAVEKAFINAVKVQTGGAAQQVSVRVDTDDSWSFVAMVGVEAHLASGWYAIASASYLPLETNTSVTTTITQSANPAALPTGDFSRSKTTVSIDPIVTYLGIGYRF